MVSIGKLQTEVVLPRFESRIGYRKPFMMMGSCFATNIGEQLVRLKFPVSVNPFGVLYNPVSIADSLKLLASSGHFTQEDLFLQDGLWCSYSHHSSFSGSNAGTCTDQINQSIDMGGIMLRESSHLVLTLGTSWAYRLKATGKVVANCHKTPASAFERIFLDTNETVEAIKEAITLVRTLNPTLKVVLTVSPIRHLKDGLVENQRSKASLLMACHRLSSEMEGISYFPAYEIMMDELRDYRFYADDMVHPSSLAIGIIFSKFLESAVEEEAVKAIPEVEKIVRAVEHRPFGFETPAHQKFRERMAFLAEELQRKYSFLDLTAEIDFFREQK